MDTALIVFIVGTVASFLPMYWIAVRLLGRQRRRVRSRMAVAPGAAEPAERREFLDLLRQEAAQRAVAILREALIEAQGATDQAHGAQNALSAATRQSLHETGRLVDSLFPGQLRGTFREGIELLMTATSGSIGAAAGAATVAIAAFERALEGGAIGKPAVSSTKPGLIGALHNRTRGWGGARDVGAAA